jgi:hypothetical protein
MASAIRNGRLRCQQKTKKEWRAGRHRRPNAADEPSDSGGGAEHCKHLRTSNVIESPFATVRLRQRITKGAGSRTKGLLMAYKLRDMAQARWRRLDGAHLLPLVRAGIGFVDGVQPEGKASKTRARAA